MQKGKGKGKGHGASGSAVELTKMMAQVLQRQQLDAKVWQLSKGPITPRANDPKKLFDDTTTTQASAGEEKNKADAERIHGKFAELRRILGNDRAEVVKRDQRLMELARQRGCTSSAQPIGEVGEGGGAY
eukprot:4340167-Amphidinium_carterae.2